MKILSFINTKWITRLRRFLFRPKKFVYVAIGDSTVEELEQLIIPGHFLH